MIHHLNKRYLERAISVEVVGAGGNGSQFINGLARLHLALRAVGHPVGLDVTLWDPDVITEANIGRQLFSPSDIGQPKAAVLINRLNAYYGLNWKANCAYYGKANADFVVGCVDSKHSRNVISKLAGFNYWLDIGNESKTGQVVLGEHHSANPETRLPTVADLFPNSITGREDKHPSCSLAEALERQDLFINQTVTTLALNLLWTLFRDGQISHHGYFVNLAEGRVTPLPIDPNAWARMGWVPVATMKAPIRRIVKTIKEKRFFHRATVQLSCGHRVRSNGALKAHCTKCARKAKLSEIERASNTNTGGACVQQARARGDSRA